MYHVLNETDKVVSSKSNMCRIEDKPKEFMNTTSYSKSNLNLQQMLFERIPRRFLKILRL